MGLAAHGASGVLWHEIDNSETFPVKGISAIVFSWFFSPILSGIVSALFFMATRAIILRQDNAYERSFFFLPFLVLFCVFIMAFYVLDKGVEQQWEYLTDHLDRSAWIAAIIAAVAAIGAVYFAFRLKKGLDAEHANKEAAAVDAEKNGGVVAKGTLTCQTSCDLNLTCCPPAEATYKLATGFFIVHSDRASQSVSLT
jgi:hypothetical protein